MHYTLRDGIVWLGIFFLLHVLLLALFVLDPPAESRGFLTEFAAGLGFVGMAFFIGQFITTGRFKSVAPSFGTDMILNFHRYAGIAGVTLVLAHPILLIATDPAYLRFFDPTDNFLRGVALITVTVAMVLIILISVRGLPRFFSYEQWRLTHSGLAVLIVVIGMGHGLYVSNYLDTLWKQGVWSAAILIAIGLLVEVRLIRPLRMRKRPYRVESVRQEQDDAWTLELAPDGHDGMAYKAGQFAWITIGDTPFQVQQNPFSMASAETDDTIQFTAQVEGDFTASWKHIEPGTHAWIDGPYGAFTIADDSKGFYFVVGGSGVVPAMSILRTMHARGDDRSVRVINCNPNVDTILFLDELRALEGELDLKVVHVLEEAPPDEVDFAYEVGLLNRDKIERYLPNDKNRYSYYSCGPGPVMDITEESLRAMGVDWRRIIPERFDFI